MASSLVAGRFARWLFAPVEVELNVDGERAADRGARLLLASAVPDVGIGMKVTWQAGREPGRFHLIAAALSTTAMALQLPRVLAGRPLVGAPHLDRLARRVEVRFAEPQTYTLDGELFRASDVELVTDRAGDRASVDSVAAARASRRSPARLRAVQLVCPSSSRSRGAIPDGAFVRVDGSASSSATGRSPSWAPTSTSCTARARPRRRDLAAARADGLTVGRVWALGEGDAAPRPWARQSAVSRRPRRLHRGGPSSSIACSPPRARAGCASSSRSPTTGATTAASASICAGPACPTGFGARDRFFSDETTRASYRAHVALLERTNTVTGVRYADDPTIFSWELMNESQVATPAGAAARRAWIAEMAAFIKARDRTTWSRPASSATRRAPSAASGSPSAGCRGRLLRQPPLRQTTDRVTSRRGCRRSSTIACSWRTTSRTSRSCSASSASTPTAPAGSAAARRLVLALPRARVLDGAAGALAWIYQPWPGHARDFGIYVDRADTDDVRAVLRKFAAVAASAPAPRNPLLGAARGDALLYDPYVTEQRSPEQRAVDGRIEIPPSASPPGAGSASAPAARPARTPTAPATAGSSARSPSRRRRRRRWRRACRRSFPAPPRPPTAAPRRRARRRRGVGALDVIPDDGAGRVERVPLGRSRAGATRCGCGRARPRRARPVRLRRRDVAARD